MPPTNHRGIQFEQNLVLRQWVLNAVGKDFATLKGWLSGSELEGVTEENVSRYYEALAVHLGPASPIRKDDLLRYDNNIVRHWNHITEKRNLLEGRTLFPKYFQYLALLFTEIYLDRYFSNSDTLLAEINKTIEDFNMDKQPHEQIEAFRESELNKLALWMATGSGKTLLMHCNLLQYQHYLDQHQRVKEIDRIILLTPNEGLSQQHLKEFRLSNIPATIFSKQALGRFINGCKIEIIDIHKLSDRSGDKTVGLAAFEGRNLVLVDEGHSGASSGGEGSWMSRRNALCENGFSFEYSATFGQAVKADRNLTQVYAKSILFDYSYRFFYEDGYGKEYRILNMEDDSHEEQRYRYLSACLLAFYQQQKVYQLEQEPIQAYLIEKPLWVLVGSSVKAVYQRNKRRVSDVLDVILFLAKFTSAENEALNKQLLDDFLHGKAGLLDEHDSDIFEQSFNYLASQGLTAATAYEDILKTLFNCSNPARLYLDILKGADGEIGLRLADNDYFGLINVSDVKALCKLAEEHEELIVEEQAISSSIFQELNKADSKINILIGARKFMGGWNSWRVSTMGLLNVGRGEGVQIIQLFGRGVRLKGKDFSLKRSNEAEDEPPQHISLVETLNVFGVRADYMRQFEEYLRDEGLSPETQKVEFILPVISNLGTQKLKVIRVKDGMDFKQDGPRPSLDLPDDLLKRKPVRMNEYPRLQAISSLEEPEDAVRLNKGKFNAQHIAFLDINQIHFALQDYKTERSWHNLNIPREKIEALLLDGSWYQLYIPPEELAFNHFAQVYRWQEIATILLKKYIDSYYKHQKAKWENDFLEYQELTQKDPNFISEYRILVEKARQDILNTLTEIKEAVENNQFQPIKYQRMSAIMFSQHLYQPLLYLGTNMNIEIKPVALNDGEKDFVEDLRLYYETETAFFKDKELYLLRNRSRGIGVGFFEAGNFYPDFILWLVDGDTQYVTFIDPKGIGRIGIEDPKINFFQTIKGLQKDLGDLNVFLNSFIISNTAFSELPVQGNRQDWEDKNVLFQVEDKSNYIKRIFATI